ncbi:M6 family metalloprotease domain-containing protein [Alkalilimnicola sp. S0819]|uniref:M6 family metalloprotease domain-containing protein n=1 Tax=Alkalilimnicola sp. S0819 TaxID=2613922 RepID=UPI0012615FB7|nr:immunoglobulin-like domain-containing protein [Alkalilimnicola sp. S0819]KAB7623908.1 DUF5011 domain-containing protein [Alkalilimnicola sp. S0819]MPQ16503.1 DUF5011 domain-containing protein [Alkalilimnicola sp. S0819]
MNRIHRLLGASLVLLALLLALPAAAMPVNPEPRWVAQPDGQRFQLQPRGDEHLHWFEQAETGAVVLFNATRQRYEYARLRQAGAQSTTPGLSLSGIALGQGKPSWAASADEARQAWRALWRRFELDQQRLLQQNPLSRKLAPSAPTRHENGAAARSFAAGTSSQAASAYTALVVMVEFTDQSFVNGASSWADRIFGGYPNAPTPGSVNDYFQEMSGNQVQIAPAAETDGTANDGLVRVQLNYPHPHHAKNTSAWNAVLQDALALADAQVDFAAFDVDGDGRVDQDELTLAFVVAGPESSYYASSTEGFWGHARFSANLGDYDGINLWTSYMGLGERQGPQGEEYDSTIGIIAHEFGHSAFGLSDLYNQPSDVSSWGLMGTGSWGYKPGERSGERPVHMIAHSRLNARLPGGQYGLVQAQRLYPGEHAQSHGIGHWFSANPSVYQILGENQSRYWLLEQRKVQGYDEGLIRGLDRIATGDTGLMIAYTNSTARVHIYRADDDPNLGLGARRDSLWFSGNAHTLGPDTVVNSAYPSGTYSGLVVENISAPGETMSFDLRRQHAPCTSHSATNPQHESAGRAYSVQEGSGWWTTTRYYAVGSGDDLGTYTYNQVTLSETTPGYFSLGNCPAPDYTPPVITLVGDAVQTYTVDPNSSGYQDPGYSAHDDVDGDISSRVGWSGGVSLSRVGTYTREYFVKDSAGNWAEVQTRTVHVLPDDGGGTDTTAPVITLQGDTQITLNLGDPWVEPGYSASDDTDGDITSQVVISGSVDSNTAGEYTLDYDVSDAAGNPAVTRTRTVTVVDNSGGCTEHTATAQGHINAGRAYACGNYNYDACAVGSDEVIGSVFLYTQITLREQPSGYYEAGSCN